MASSSSRELFPEKGRWAARVRYLRWAQVATCACLAGRDRKTNTFSDSRIHSSLGTSMTISKCQWCHCKLLHDQNEQYVCQPAGGTLQGTVGGACSNIYFAWLQPPRTNNTFISHQISISIKHQHQQDEQIDTTTTLGGGGGAHEQFVCSFLVIYPLLPWYNLIHLRFVVTPL